MGNIQSLYTTIEQLQTIKPDFISVTYGAGGSLINNLTCDIASTIKKRYNIEAVAHLTCVNSSRTDVQNMIKKYMENNIENVMALRGDKVSGGVKKTDFLFSHQLAIELQRLSKGDLEIIGACYPEGHFEAITLDEDIQNLKYKIGAGVQILISQLFFDNEIFYSFLEKVRACGITIPISAGIMPIVSQNQIEKTLFLSGATIPSNFSQILDKGNTNPSLLYDLGIEYASAQIRDLLSNGVDGIHLYTMNKSDVAINVYNNIKDLL